MLAARLPSVDQIGFLSTFTKLTILRLTAPFNCVQYFEPGLRSNCVLISVLLIALVSLLDYAQNAF